MTEQQERIKLPERHGVIGVTRNERGDLVFLSVPQEDLDKVKSERVSDQFGADEDYFKVKSDSLGFVSGGVKNEEFSSNELASEAFQQAFAREVQSEIGLSVDHIEFNKSLDSVGVIEQNRNGEATSFIVWMLSSVSLTDQQIASLKGAVIVPLEQAAKFLEENKDRVRPVARAAVNKILDQEQKKNK